MKTLLGTNKYAVIILGTIACVVILACANAEKPKGKVEIRKDGITIHPVIKLSSPDEKKLDIVLRKYDKKLYRIVTWEKGKVTKVRGRGAITETQKAEATEAQKQGWAENSENSVCPDALGCPSQNLTANDKQLLKELGALLRKY